MIRKGIIYIIILFFIGAAAQGQEYTSTNKKAVKLYEKALEALYQGKSDAARNTLEQALKEDDGFLEAHLVMADLLQDAEAVLVETSGEVQCPTCKELRAEAKEHLRNVVEQRSDFFVPAWLQLGKLELTDGHFDEAISCLETFMRLNKKEDEDRVDAERCLTRARFRKEALSHPVAFDPQNLGAGVNSAEDEYLPSLTADGGTLVFTRRFPRKSTTTASTQMEEDLYTSSWKEGTWGKATRMPEPVNSTDNEGAQCISQDGRIMFFTACNRADGGGRCDLYMCVNRGGSWSKPRNLGPTVNSGAWESNPTFSIDGKTLYFVSNRKGGHGGMDIWKTTFENGKWTEPVNMGPEINSESDEMTPFIHFDDRTLYFASNRAEGMGGLDLFKTTRQKDGSWSKPENLGYPINTDGDESGLIVSADGRTAIYASDRRGGYGKQDLYSFELPEAQRAGVAVCMTGRVSDATSGNAVGADIKVIDLKSGETVANTSSDQKDGRYTVSLPAGRSYAVHVSAKGYLFHSQNEQWEHGASGKWEPRQVDIGLHPIRSGERIALRNVFFETGRWELLPQSQVELDKVVELMKQNPELKIELGGHTDNVGQAEANLRLSEQRARSVYDYLKGKGIAADRLTFKGYGETQPVADNDTEAGRAANRRTEMKVL